MASKALTIFQVGDQPLLFFPDSWHGYAVKSNNSMTALAFSRKLYPGYAPRIVTDRSISTTGTAVALRHMTVNEQMNLLNTLVGVETDIIGIEWLNCCDDLNCYGGACGNPAGGDILVLETYGFIDRVNAAENSDLHTLSLTFQIADDWQPLNRLIWEWSDRKPSVMTTSALPASNEEYLRPIPFGEDILTAHCSGYYFVKRRYPGYDPAAWVADVPVPDSIDIPSGDGGGGI